MSSTESNHEQTEQSSADLYTSEPTPDQIDPSEEAHQDGAESFDLDEEELLPLGTDLPEGHRSGFVSLIGRPNVGKSTLLNQLLGQKIAIISEKPQTTRDQILGIRTDEHGQYIFLDTPGIHRPLNKLGKHMVQIAEQTIAEDSDLVLWLVDINLSPTDEDRMISQRLRIMDDEYPIPQVLLGFNKVDEWSGSEEKLEARKTEYVDLVRWLVDDEEGLDDIPELLFSARTGTGLDILLATLHEFLPDGPRFYPADQVTNLNMRFLAAELIREQALAYLRHEVPHGVAVIVTDFEERDDDMTYIAATLYVERESQKGIVLGRKGSMIKQIGQSARPQIEELVGTQVYLDLWVKVREKWRRREQLLRQLGYGLAVG